MRKSVTAFFIFLFVVGWGVRVLVPAYQARQRRPDKERRNDSLKVVVDRLYEFAATNDSSFPKSLDELGALTNSFRQRIDFNDYLFRPSARVHSEKIDGTRIVVGENPITLRDRNLCFVSVEGNYTITLSKSNYITLLKQNGLLN